MAKQFFVIKLTKNKNTNHKTNKKVETFSQYDAAKAYVNNVLSGIAINWSYQENADFYRVSGYDKNHNYFAGLERKDKSIQTCFLIKTETVYDDEE